jgi:hypothetical protein
MSKFNMADPFSYKKRAADRSDRLGLSILWHWWYIVLQETNKWPYLRGLSPSLICSQGISDSLSSPLSQGYGAEISSIVKFLYQNMSAERILKIALFDPHREGNQWIEIPE